MKLDKIYREEDLFPREITTYEEKITDLDAVLRDIVGFYTKKGIVNVCCILQRETGWNDLLPYYRGG